MMFEHASFEHESVHAFACKKSGLKSIIAIHSTVMGPAIGGCRMLPYATSSDALDDVLRLSRGMTYKCAIAEIPFGGGKAVILGDPMRHKSPELLQAFATRVQSLNGKYITSFDAGTNLEDVRYFSKFTSHVGGLQPNAGNASQSTASTVFACLIRAMEMQFGSRSVQGRHVTIQGSGNVGLRLARKILDAGGRVTIADINSASLAKAAKMGCATVDPNEIAKVESDAFAPCALGGVIDATVVDQMSAPIICGGANNQLSAPEMGERLTERGILYCPDFLANSGGIIDLDFQLHDRDRDHLTAYLDRIADKLFDIVEQAKQTGSSAEHVAEQTVRTTLGR